jgi:hypothetical protein
MVILRFRVNRVHGREEGILSNLGVGQGLVLVDGALAGREVQEPVFCPRRKLVPDGSNETCMVFLSALLDTGGSGIGTCFFVRLGGPGNLSRKA